MQLYRNDRSKKQSFSSPSLQIMKNLSGKVVVITGGNSGIGLASAKAFKAAGAKVIINARNEDRLQQTLKEQGNAFDDVLIADVANVAELEAFYKKIGEKYGKIDLLFLNAGVAYFAPIEVIDEDFYDQQFNVNVKGVLFSVQKALPYLQPGSSIQVTSSVVNQMGMPNASVYAATKAAVRSITRTLAAELAERKIRVNTISPGPIQTPIFGKMGMPEEQVGEMAGQILSQIPLGRFGQSEEIAQAAIFLAQNEFVTGTEVVVDGGMSQL